MILNLNISVDLEENEVKFLRVEFSQNHKKILNAYWIILKLKSELMESLIKKSVLIKDEIGNCKLTPIGVSIMNEIDRDKRLEKLLE